MSLASHHERSDDHSIRQVDFALSSRSTSAFLLIRERATERWGLHAHIASTGILSTLSVSSSLLEPARFQEESPLTMRDHGLILLGLISVFISYSK